MNTILTAKDGHTFNCWIEPAVGNTKGNLIILQEIFGVTDQLKGVARRYAQQGFQVAIPALFDRYDANVVVPFDQPMVGLNISRNSDLTQTLNDIEATVSHLNRNQLNVAVMGFCWGGGLAVKCAQTFPLAAAVAFYGTQLPLYLQDDLRAPVQAHFGLHDDHTPKALVESVTQRFPDIETYWYEAGHAFANDARQNYVADAAELAHERSTEFLTGHLVL